MRFAIRSVFEAKAAVVEQALFHPDLPAYLEQHLTLVRRVEPLERHEDEREIRRRVRYVPKPVIERVGPRRVPAEWMAWVEESRYERARRRMEFRNVPDVGRVRALLENHGTLELRDGPAGQCWRSLEGELRVRVPLLGAIAERIIHARAAEIVEEEARVVAKFIRERALG